MPVFPNLVGLTPAAAHTAYTAAGFTGSGNASYGLRPYNGLVNWQDVQAGSTQPAATDVGLAIGAPSGNVIIWGS